MTPKNSRRETIRKISLAGFSALAAAIAFFGAIVVRSAFLEPPRPPPAEPGVVELLNVGPDYQQVKGKIEADKLWIRSIGRWASETRTKIVMAVAGGRDPAIASCGPGYQLIACSGSMDSEGLFSCGGNKIDCGFIGVVPVDAAGVRSTTNATGCKVMIDPGGAAEPTAFAYCIQKSF